MILQRRIQRQRTPPCLNIFEIFDSKTRINIIVINMQCTQYVLYSLLSLQKQRVCVKGHQNNLQTLKIIPRRGRAPWFLNSWIRHCFIFSNIFDITINFTNRENRNHVNFYSSLDDAFGRTCVCCVVTLHSLRIASVINIIIFVFTEK